MAKRRLDEFQLGESIGIGTVGTLYAATETTSGQSVALKILLPIAANDSLVIARFEREMLILEKLTHPNIVRYYGGGRSEGQLFYAMELVQGGSLKEVIQSSGPLTWPEVVTIGIQVCSALQHSHNHGIIHRDLKPGNLFVSHESQVKLGDFGIARDMDEGDLTVTGLTVGTRSYMSPEQITGEIVSGKSDLYSLGCVLFELLVGKPPFQGANFAQLFEQHLRHAPPDIDQLVPDLPATLADLIGRLLAKDPEERPFNARTVQGVLLELSAEPYEDLATTSDVAAASIRDQGTARLGQRVHALQQPAAVPEISWWSLAAIAGLVVVLILAALAFAH